MHERYYQAVWDTDRELALGVVHAALDAGLSPESVVFDVILPTFERMLIGFTQTGESNLSQHFVASKVSEEAVELLLPRFRKAVPRSGVIVLGSARGDFHGLGKSIVRGCLRAQMYEVHDLGLNVLPEVFVQRAEELHASIIGISAMMIHTATGPQGPRGVRALLRERGLPYKLMVGGAPFRFDRELFRKVEADAWADSALEAPRVVEALLREVR